MDIGGFNGVAQTVNLFSNGSILYKVEILKYFGREHLKGHKSVRFGLNANF